MSKKYVYHFKEAFGLGKELLGGKGAGLAEMTHIGVPIPQGFTVTTEACTLYYDSGKQLPDYLVEEIYNAIAAVEKETGKNFGGNTNPLLVSVRSGARVSMPGMMDTILNLGLNDTTVEVLAKETNNERFAYDSYRRFILMFTNIAKGHPRTDMDKMLEDLKEFPRLTYEQGINNSFYFSEELHSTIESPKNIIVSDRATLFNLLIGLNGYTISSGILSSDLNGTEIVSIPLQSDEMMEIGYIHPTDHPLSEMSERYLEHLRLYIAHYQSLV